MQRDEEAAMWRTRAETALHAGDGPEAVACLRRAIALYTARDENEPSEDRAHAETCRRLANLLAEADRLPEAMQAYQEAADAFGYLPGAETEARECARRIVEGVRALRHRPEERLYLLTARYEREQRQLAASPGTEAAQADCAFHIATIFHRRERPSEAEARYLESLSLYRRAPDTGLRQALCHHRLAALYHYDLREMGRAADHYREAIRLYGEFEEYFEGEQMNRVLCEQLLRAVLTDGAGR